MDPIDITTILGIDFAHLTVANIILLIVVLCGILSHVVPEGSKIQKVFNVVGALTFKANRPAAISPTQANSGIVSKVMKNSIYIGICTITFAVSVFLLFCCKPAVAIADLAYDLCVKSMKDEPLVIQAAQSRKLDVLGYTKEICTVAEVIHPYVEFMKAEPQDAGPKQLIAPPTPRALQAAHARELL
jgi:hypothetical protein